MYVIQNKTLFKNYLRESFEGEDYGWIKENMTGKEIATAIYETFKKEKCNRDKINFITFLDWCQGLPSIIDTCYYYNRSALVDLVKLGFNIKEYRELEIEEELLENIVTTEIWHGIHELMNEAEEEEATKKA